MYTKAIITGGHLPSIAYDPKRKNIVCVFSWPERINLNLLEIIVVIVAVEILMNLFVC